MRRSAWPYPAPPRVRHWGPGWAPTCSCARLSTVLQQILVIGTHDLTYRMVRQYRLRHTRFRERNAFCSLQDCLDTRGWHKGRTARIGHHPVAACDLHISHEDRHSCRHLVDTASSRPG